MQLEPGTIVENRYRIERLVASHTGVTVWDATDLMQACTVELVLSHGGTMIDVAKVPLRGVKPVLELVEITDEDAFFEEPPPPELFYTPPPPRSKAPWFLGVAAIACAAIGVGAWYTKHASARTLATNEEVTITQAELPLPAMTTPPPPPLPSTVMTVVEAPRPVATQAPKAVVAPKRVARPQHRAAPPPSPPPLPQPSQDDPQTL